MKLLSLIFLVLFSLTSYAQVSGDTAVNLTFSGRINEAKGVAISAASTVSLGSVAGNTVHISGLTSITSFGAAAQAGIRRVVLFDDSLTLTHSASLVLPSASDIQTAAGDSATFVSDSTSIWKLVDYKRVNGAPLISPLNMLFGGAIVAKTGNATLSAAEILAGSVFKATSQAAITLTIDTKANLDSSFVGEQAGWSFPLVLINVGSSTMTLAAGTSTSISGSAAVTIGTSATFIGKYSASNTIVFTRQ